ncbi:MAG: preprotein translocase subunit SecE [Anaerolineaceae bacterium]|nr:preprotein translocase subunit SecE [Anaerolineaceae bacterium]
MSAKNKQANLIVDDVEELENDTVEDEAEDEAPSTRGITAPKGRATPGRRTQEVEEEKAESGIVGGITSPFRSMIEYWEGVRSEMQKVIWPTRDETQRLATIVLIVTIVSSIVLGLLSLIFTAVIAAGLNSPLIVFGGILLVSLVGFGYYLRSSNRGSSLF